MHLNKSMAYNIVHQKGDRRSCISNVKNNGVHQSAFDVQFKSKEPPNRDRFIAICLEDLHGVSRAYFMTLQKDHDFSDLFLFLPCFGDPLGSDRADTLCLPQPLWTIFNDIKRIQAKLSATILLAIIGPIPLIKLDPKYFWMPTIVAGSTERQLSTRNCCPNLVSTTHCPLSLRVPLESVATALRQ